MFNQDMPNVQYIGLLLISDMAQLNRKVNDILIRHYIYMYIK